EGRRPRPSEPGSPGAERSELPFRAVGGRCPGHRERSGCCPEPGERHAGSPGATGPAVHGVLSGSPLLGVFLTPDGANPGAIETLCRQAVRDLRLAACVDQLIGCAGTPHAAHGNPRVAEAKGWLRAYLGMILEPNLMFHQAFDHPQGI